MKEYIAWKARNQKLLQEFYQEYKEQVSVDFDTFCRKLHTHTPIQFKTNESLNFKHIHIT
jgi:hypothetical protein